MTAIFAKTRKGQEEIEQRSGGLGPRPRRVLILIDGKRPLDEVRAMMPDPRLDEALAQLQEEGYIERIGGSDPPPPAAVEEAVVAPAGPVDPVQMDKARNFMLNALRTFNGPYGNLGLMKRINESRTPADLRGLLEEWLATLNLTKMGQLRSEELKGRLLAVL